MTTAEVRAALRRRWPDTEYLMVEEAPESSDRSGRRLDALVISLWRSRGLELDGVEIKVSLADWRRELQNARKADFWWLHTHRFWIAVPAALAEKVREDLPAGWGLLACEGEGAPAVVVKAARRDAEPISWGTAVGLMRASAGAGTAALQRAEARGREHGRREGIEEGKRYTSEGGAEKALARLRERVAAFEEASGLTISAAFPGPAELGAYVAIVRKEMRAPGYLSQGVAWEAERAVAAAQALVKHATEVQAVAARIGAALAAPPPTTAETGEEFFDRLFAADGAGGM